MTETSVSPEESFFNGQGENSQQADEETSHSRQHEKWQRTYTNGDVREHNQSEDHARIVGYAREMQAAGLHPMPPMEDGSKRPLGYPPGSGKWEKFQKDKLSPQEFHDLFIAHRRTGLGCLTGTTKTVTIDGKEVTLYHEVLEFDDRETYEDWRQAAIACGYGWLVQRIEAGWVEYTPRGVHLHYWTPAGEPNQKLAQYLDEKGHPKAISETRGLGGYVITGPSFGKVHPSGQTYVRVSGGPHSMAIVSAEERTELFRIAKSFDQIPPEKERVYQEPKTDQANTGTRPGDLYAAKTSWREILESAGWTFLYESQGKGYWRRPGKDRGVSATTNYADSGYLYVFSTSTPFEANRGYGKFSAYAILNHNGDWEQAAEDLMGKGFYQGGSHGSNGSSNFADHGREYPGDEGDTTWSWDSQDNADDKRQEQTSSDGQPQTIYNAATLKNREFPPQKQAVDEVLPVGLCVLAGPPKIGKSFLALNIGCAVKSGGPALSRFDVSQGDCLYLALEDSPRRIQNRLIMLLGDFEEWPAELPDFAHEVPGGWQNLQPFLTKWLDEHQNARLVVIDTFAKVKPPRKRNEDPYQADYAIAAQLQRLALNRDIALLLVLHTKKGPEEDFISAVSGTHGVTGAADVVMVLKRKRGELEGILSITGRDIEERDLAMKSIDGDWLCMGDAAEVKRSESRKKILDVLREGGSLTPAEISTVTMMPRGTVRRLLSKMLEKGEVRKDGEKYSLPIKTNEHYEQE